MNDIVKELLYTEECQCDNFKITFSLERIKEDGESIVELYAWIEDENTIRRIKLDINTIDVIHGRIQTLKDELINSGYPPLNRC